MPARRTVIAAAAALAVVVVGVVTVVVVRSGDDSRDKKAGTLFVEPSSTPSPAVAEDSSGCDTVERPFEPDTITVAGVARKVPVIKPPRDANNVPGIPPLSNNGKNVFAYDRKQKVKPGALRGNVLLNAHTFPDGSALGNRLLDNLKRDGRIDVWGKKEQRLCYRVTKRVQVLATATVPAYYSRTGTPQLAIIVCSGRRLGPGQWEKRTIWYASPSS